MTSNKKIKTPEQRINNIVGQLNGINKMLKSQGEDCLVVLTQLKAVKSAVSSLMEVVMENRFNSCLKRTNDKDQLMAKKIFSEIIKK